MRMIMNLPVIMFSLLIIGTAQVTEAKVEFDSTSLMLKNSDEVDSMIKAKIKKAQLIQSKQEETDDGEVVIEQEALEYLKDALRIALSRPDRPEGARATLYGGVRRELRDLNALDQALSELTEEALSELRNQEGPRRAATYVVLLENMMAELRPEIAENPPYRKIIERIRDAKIAINPNVKVQNRGRTMSVPVSPSDTADKLLKSLPASTVRPKGAAPKKTK